MSTVLKFWKSQTPRALRDFLGLYRDSRDYFYVFLYRDSRDYFYVFLYRDSREYFYVFLYRDSRDYFYVLFTAVTNLNFQRRCQKIIIMFMLN
jgi:hypothetical protein